MTRRSHVSLAIFYVRSLPAVLRGPIIMGGLFPQLSVQRGRSATLVRNPAALNIRYYAIISRSDICLLRGCGVTSSFHRPKEFDRYKYRPAFVWARSLLAKHSMLHRFTSTRAYSKNEKWRALAARRAIRLSRVGRKIQKIPRAKFSSSASSNRKRAFSSGRWCHKDMRVVPIVC